MVDQVIRDVFGKFGYQISRIEPSHSASHAKKSLLAAVPAPVIFDVGASIGKTIDAYRDLFPASKIVGFEPFEESFAEARLRETQDGQTRVFNLALGAVNGPENFHVNSSAPTNSLLATDDHGPKVWGKGLLETQKTVQVDVVRLDDFLAKEGIQRVDLLKLDVQGAEPLVLEGAADTLANNRIGIIYTEIITMPTYVGQKSFDEMLKLFADRNFQLYNIYNCDSVDGWLRQVDAIFVNKEFAAL
jgi:FkbM family methyltransferase